MGDQQGAGPLRLVYPRPRWRLAPSRCHQPDRIDPRPAADDRLLLLPLTEPREIPALPGDTFRNQKSEQGTRSLHNPVEPDPKRLGPDVEDLAHKGIPLPRRDIISIYLLYTSDAADE